MLIKNIFLKAKLTVFTNYCLLDVILETFCIQIFYKLPKIGIWLLQMDFRYWNQQHLLQKSYTIVQLGLAKIGLTFLNCIVCQMFNEMFIIYVQRWSVMQFLFCESLPNGCNDIYAFNRAIYSRRTIYKWEKQTDNLNPSTFNHIRGFVTIFNVSTLYLADAILLYLFSLYRDPYWQMRVNENNARGVAGHTETFKHTSKNRVNQFKMLKIHSV